MTGRAGLAGLVAAVVAVGGCDNLFNLNAVPSAEDRLRDGGDDADDSMAADAFVAKDCSSVHFSMSTLTEDLSLASSVAGDPWMSDDQLELFFVKSPGSPYEIWRAHRASKLASFDIALAKESFNFAGLDNFDPSVTADGKLLVYIVNLPNGYHVHYTERDADGLWSNAALVPGVESFTIKSAQISWDGLTLYFNMLDEHLYMTTRASRSAAFGPALDVSPTSTTFATESTDGLELYCDNTIGGIYRATRTQTNVAFGSQTREFTVGKDPQLSIDSTRLVISYDNTIAVLTRTCP